MDLLVNRRGVRGFAGLIVGFGALLSFAGVARGQVSYQVLHAFLGPCATTEGCLPVASLLQASDGNFYGTTESGGAFGAPTTFATGGTVFKITPTGTLTTLHSFDCTNRFGPEGCFPVAGLIQASDGNFYGTTRFGGAAGRGTVFRITPTGTLTTLRSFDCATEGCGPAASLLQASDGDFYGTTEFGGAAGGGTIFKITAPDTLTTLHSFDCATEGCSPWAGLIQASDGNFYGTTPSGGAAGTGTIFRITAAGALTTLHSFDCDTDGCESVAGLLRGSDGNFYGTTPFGGAAGLGTVFKITPAGTLTTLHSFDCALFSGDRTSNEGCIPFASLIQANDGNFYGTTESGGAADRGTVFKITPRGTLTTVHSFICATEGCPPHAALIQASDGNFYGTAKATGPATRNEDGGGVVFRIVTQGLTGLSPAKMWLGLKNSDDVGLRLDLRADVFVNGTRLAGGQLDNVSGGSSGFNNALLHTIPLALTGRPANFPSESTLQVKIAVRRTCSGGGHASGLARLWFNGQPVDSDTGRDAGSRVAATIDAEIPTDYFLRPSFALSPEHGMAKQAVDVNVDSKQACPDREFKPFGTWSITP